MSSKFAEMDDAEWQGWQREVEAITNSWLSDLLEFEAKILPVINNLPVNDRRLARTIMTKKKNAIRNMRFYSSDDFRARTKKVKL